jgi:hypothetical protein
VICRARCCLVAAYGKNEYNDMTIRRKIRCNEIDEINSYHMVGKRKQAGCVWQANGRPLAASPCLSGLSSALCVHCIMLCVQTSNSYDIKIDKSRRLSGLDQPSARRALAVPCQALGSLPTHIISLERLRVVMQRRVIMLRSAATKHKWSGCANVCEIALIRQASLWILICKQQLECR